MHHLNKMKHYLTRGLLPTAICLATIVGGLVPSCLAQFPARIDVLVIEGEGVTSKTRQRVAHDPVVKVEDDDHQPVPGVAVVFALPASGTTGEFLNGSKTLTVVTDKNGLATAHGIKTNDVPGKLQIYTTASLHGLHAQTLINQFVEAEAGAKPQTAEVRTAKSGGKWKWALLGVAAAGGAGAGVYFGRHSTAGAPISISAGSVVFGSAH
jgi:hypothetical protein